MGNFAALTAADVYVIAALTALALSMWLARRFVGWLLHFLPIAVALLATGGAYAMWLAGEQMNWDSPGSPGILIVIGALVVSVFFAIAGWIAVAIQIRRWRKPAPPRTESAMRIANSVRVLLVIAFVVWSLGSMYRYYRSHLPSHDSAVAQLVFSGDGESLYSLDAEGVLKRWSTRHLFEAETWNLPIQSPPDKMLVSGDGKTLVTLHEQLLRSWSLTAGPQVRESAALPDVAAVASIDGEHLVVARAGGISLRPYADVAAVAASSATEVGVLSVAPYPQNGVMVGLEDRTLRVYDASGGTLAARAVPIPGPLEALPGELRVDRTGRFVVVSDREKQIVALDLQNMRQDVIPEYFLPGKLEISGGGELLLGQVGITGYDLAERRSEPLFNHGGTIAALAISPRADHFAVGDRKQIYIVADSTYYGAPYKWLNGKVELDRLSSLARAAVRR